MQLSVNADSHPNESYEIRAHRAEGPFRNYVIGKLVFNGGGWIAADSFINNGAEIFGVMQVTTTRWMEKLWSDVGPLMRDTREVNKRSTLMVAIKPEFWSTASRDIKAKEAASIDR